MSKKLAEKVAIVTGSSKGIGAAIAIQLAKEGASVVVNYASSKADADHVVSEITRNGGKAIAVEAHINKEANIIHLFSETKKKFGKLDILVNNAGIYQFAPLEEVTVELYHKMFDLNVLGLLLSSREAVKLFGSSGGSIINISSVSSTARQPNASIYGATKSAVDGITWCLSTELGPRKIRVNAVNPGMIETEGTHSAGIVDSEFREKVVKHTPLGRIGQPEEVATVVAFLASDDAKWITGETIRVSGGDH